MNTKDWIISFVISALASLLIWFLTEFWRTIMNHVISFFVTFSPVFIGILVFFIYWFIKDYKQLRKFKNEQINFVNGQISEYHNWLKNHPQAQYDEGLASLEVRIHSMLKWWSDTQK